MRALAVLLLMPTIAQASICGTHSQAIAATEKFGEVIKESELAYQSAEYIGWLQWTENKTTQSWSLLLTANGQTCIIASNKPRGPES